jgi:hypothetical protein
MPCRKCGKKKVHPTRSVVLYNIEAEDGVEDRDIYSVQSRMHTVVATPYEKLRFLTGEKVNIIGTLLFNLLSSDTELFIFLSGAEKRDFLTLHPTLEGMI